MHLFHQDDAGNDGNDECDDDVDDVVNPHDDESAIVLDALPSQHFYGQDEYHSPQNIIYLNSFYLV